MRDTGSRTAEQVALFRALETGRSDRLFTDPYARCLLPGSYRAVVRLADLGGRSWIERYIDRRWSGGPRGSAVVRTRLIDDRLTAALTDGSDQVLLLGAGYDSRAYRIPGLDRVTTFEVDHPATQAHKRRRLAGLGSPSVRYVPADLDHDDLGAALLGAGFVVAARTVVIWEGVTNYLSEPAVDATLGWLATRTGPGSRIIFTYVDRAALDGTARFDGFDQWRAAVAASGEPWTFGFHPAELAGHLHRLGLRLTEDLSTRDAAGRYLAPLGRSEPTAQFYRIAIAEVPGAQGQ